MSCATGEAYLLDTAGDPVYCVAPEYVGNIEVAGFGDLAGELLYLIERLPMYVVAAGAMVGVLALFITAMAVKALMS